ncbi:MAG: DnaD domain protein [Clostridiales bacterium]|nr:DnaD domain protein [Clostridiales bacterium]
MDKFEVRREWHYTIVENHILETNLSTQAKLLYVILCKYANRNKECFPNYETLMKDIGVKSKATLSNALKELTNIGVLEIISGKEEGRSNVYIIKDNPLDWIGCSPNEQGCSPNEQGGVHQMNRGCSATVHELKPYNYNHINKNHLTDDDEGEQHQQIKKIVDVFNSNIHNITPIEFEKLSSWLEDMEAEVIIKAIEEAVTNNKRSMNYINKILNNWFNQGLKTKVDVEEYLRNWNKKKEQPKSSWKEADLTGLI